MKNIDQQQRVVAAPSQVLKMEPVVAAVYGGGTSAVVMRGADDAGEGVRVRIEEQTTSATRQSFLD